MNFNKCISEFIFLRKKRILVMLITNLLIIELFYTNNSYFLSHSAPSLLHPSAQNSAVNLSSHPVTGMTGCSFFRSSCLERHTPNLIFLTSSYQHSYKNCKIYSGQLSSLRLILTNFIFINNSYPQKSNHNSSHISSHVSLTLP